jgi:hypothetical protein
MNSKSTKQSSNQAIKQSSNQAIKQSSNQAIKQSSNQAIQSMNKLHCSFLVHLLEYDNIEDEIQYIQSDVIVAPSRIVRVHVLLGGFMLSSHQTDLRIIVLELRHSEALQRVVQRVKVVHKLYRHTDGA